MLFDDDSVGENDLKTERTITLNNESAFIVEKKAPYDFWFIRWSKGGMLPPGLSGSWTSFYNARKAIEQYCKEKEVLIKDISY